MALRIRKDGRILCAAIHEEEEGDIYVDDAIHYHLSVVEKVLVTENMDWGRLGGHRLHGQWWWKGKEPENATIAEYYNR